MNIEQYKIVAARREHGNNRLWQTPPLAIAAQAFLLNAAFSGQTAFQLPLTALACVTGMAAMFLMFRHRQFERADTKWLEAFDQKYLPDKASEAFEPIHEKKGGLSAFLLWMAVLGALTLFSLMIFGYSWRMLTEVPTLGCCIP